MDSGTNCPAGCPLIAATAEGRSGYEVVLYKLDEVIAAQKETNGRLRTVEKFTWAIGGGLILLGNLAAIYAALHGHT